MEFRMLTETTESYRIYDDFLSPEEAQNFTEALRGREIPFSQLLEDTASNATNVLNENERLLITFGIRDLFRDDKSGTLAFLQSSATNSVDMLGLTLSISVCPVADMNSSFCDGLGPALAYYVYYPVSEWDPERGGGVLMKPYGDKGTNNIIYPKPNRLMILKPGAVVKINQPGHFIGCEPLITIHGCIVTEAYSNGETVH